MKEALADTFRNGDPKTPSSSRSKPYIKADEPVKIEQQISQ